MIDSIKIYLKKKFKFLKKQLAENNSPQLKSLLSASGSIYRDSANTNEYDEYLASPEESLIHIDSVYVDFGASRTAQMLDQQNVQEKSISILNKTKSKIVIFWNQNEQQPFKISPLSCDIPAMKSCSFRIKFEPVN